MAKGSHHHDLIGETGKKLVDIVKHSPSFVRYHMTGCGHCIAMENDWKKLVKEGKESGLAFVNVEQSALQHIPEHLKKNVSGFPTLVSYAKGGVDRMDYEGERTAESMKNWLKEIRRGDWSKPTGSKGEGSRLYLGNSYGGGTRRRSRRAKKSRRHTRKGGRSHKKMLNKRASMRRRAAVRKHRSS